MEETQRLQEEIIEETEETESLLVEVELRVSGMFELKLKAPKRL